ncbi:S8 family serine peptidase, partial [candidate division KSB1 bacterium]|nr:S8 family serine peptidase [candidate division KSB1 bacterium]
MKLKLSLDASTVENKARTVHQGNYSVNPPSYAGFTGKAVLVSTIDSGIDWGHEDFIDDRTRSSRIQFIWDQTLVPVGRENHPTGFSYGVEYSQADINNEIDGSPAYFVRSKDTNGHGSHVMGIIAGDGSSSGNGVAAYTYVGMAPEAQLLAIKTGLSDAQIIDAVYYAMRKAEDLGLPLVINLSLGNQQGAHDGTHLLDQAMNNAVNSGKAIIVVAAGNEGTDASHAEYIHAEGTVSQGSSHILTFQVPVFTTDIIDMVAIDLWYQGRDNLNIKITTPNGLNYSTSTGSLVSYSTSEGNIDIDNASAGLDLNNGDHECQISI